jgi:uncharacterized protein YfaS (alpha-2-macroglobulin family)
MNMYDIGDQVRLSVSIADSGGSAVDPSAITVKIKTPSGAESDNTPAKDSTGNYHYDLLLTEKGKWYYRFVGSGANNPGAVESVLQVVASKFTDPL